MKDFKVANLMRIEEDVFSRCLIVTSGGLECRLSLIFFFFETRQKIFHFQLIKKKF
jgi:hypothetical protein